MNELRTRAARCPEHHNKPTINGGMLLCYLILVCCSVSFNTAAYGLNSEPTEVFNYAVQQYKLKNFGEAARYFQIYASKGDAPTGFYWTGVSLYADGKTDLAIDCLWYVSHHYASTKSGYEARNWLKRVDTNFQAHSSNLAFGKIATLQSAPLVPLGPSKRSLINKMIVVEHSRTASPEVHDEFIQAIREELAKMPEALVKLLSTKGCQVLITPTMLDDDPRLSHSQPGGYDADADFNAVPARFDMHNIIVGEYTLVNGKYQTNDDPCGCLRHELGHAFDVYEGDISDHDPFKHSWWNDCRVTTPQLTTLAYYLRKGRAGPAETLAELFCLKFGGRKNFTEQDLAKELKTVFPECAKDLDGELAKLK